MLWILLLAPEKEKEEEGVIAQILVAHDSQKSPPTMINIYDIFY